MTALTLHCSGAASASRCERPSRQFSPVSSDQLITNAATLKAAPRMKFAGLSVGAIRRALASLYLKPLWWRLGFGVVAAVVATMARMALHDSLGNRVAYVTYFPAVEIAALIGGFASGGIATATAALFAHVWVTPLANGGDWLGLAFFVASAIFVSGLTEVLHRAWISKAAAEKLAIEERATIELLAEKAQLATQFASVAASVPGVICSFRQTAEGKQSFPYASAKCFDVYGIAPEILQTDAGLIFRRIHADDLHHVQATIANSARRGTVWRDEFRYDHPKKGIIWLEGQSSPILEPSGAITWHGYVQDVTERKRAEQELRISEARFRAFFDCGLIGVISWSINGAITDANDTFLQMLGYDREDLKSGRIDWQRMTPPEFRHIDEEAAANVTATGAARPFEKEYFRKDGTRVPVLIAAAALDASHRDGVELVLDMSERKQAEAQLQQLHAERLNSVKSMAAGLAHEINQPLAATKTYVNVARRLLDMKPEDRTSDVATTLEKAATQVTRAGQIVTRLRDFIVHGEPDKTSLHLHEVILSAYDALGVAKERGIEVTLQLDAERDDVLADRVQIEQVLVNLIRNAEEAMAASARRDLTISTSSSEDDFRIDIADTGVGLSDTVKSTLFQPFTTTKTSGMGVGLAISQAIIDAHDGKMWVRANPEGGTIFSFTLPLAESTIGLGAEPLATAIDG